MNVLIIGSRGHAKVVIEIFREMGGHEVVGLIDRFRPVGEAVDDLRVLGSDEDIPKLREALEVDAVFVAIGDNHVRASVTASAGLLTDGLPFAKAIHPRACVSRSARVGPGTAIMAGAVIGPDAVVAEHCIVNTRASLDHDGIMDRFASLGPGSTLGGGARVREGAAVGLGASVIHGITIGEHAVIGAGATVVRDIPAYAVALGTPARVVRSRKPGDRYL